MAAARTTATPPPPHDVRHDVDGIAMDHLVAWRELFDGCCRIADLEPRREGTAIGVIQRLRLVPGESMEAVIHDGTGRLRAVWTGEPLTGLELGRGLRLEGTVCLESGSPVMRNPSWRIVRDPYACAEQERRDRQERRGR